jgi:hypothetical protein
MPTYKSKGIGASLVVAQLDGTLCDEIQLGMGPYQREEAERIKLQLLNGRTLQERPVGQNHSMVGVLQFVGDERDMALFAVEAGEPGGGSLGSPTSLANVEIPSVTASTISQSLTNSSPTSMVEPAQLGASHKKKKRKTGKYDGSSNYDQIILLATPPPIPKQPQRRAVNSDEPLALGLKVDCEDFIKSDDMQGKDLKIEVFLNGQLVDVTFENHRQSKSRGKYLYSGKRFHRQAEKPWIYVPGTASSNTGDLAAQRWANICQTLEDEAAQRGMDQKRQRPLSAQFLIALARLQLPDSVSARSGNFAVIDVVITAGTGRKHGAETSYITAPTRLFDGNFKGIFPVEDDFGQHPDPYDYMKTHDAFVHMPFADPGYSNFQTSDFLNTQIQPSAFMDVQFPTYPKQQMLPPPSPRTPPKREYKNTTTQTYRKVLEATPIKKLLSNYEDAHGRIKGKRTLKQRLGDMSKMSPRKRLEVINELKKELDDKTVDTIKQAFEIDCLDPTTPTSKKVQFSSDAFDLRPVSDDDDAEVIFGQPINTVNALDPYNFGQPINTVNALDPYNFAYDLPPPQPQFSDYGSGFAQMPYFPQGTSPFQQIMMPPSPAQWFASAEQTMMQPSPTQMPPPPQRSIPPVTPSKETPAYALSNSPIHLPVKKWPAQRRREALIALSDEKDDQQQPSIPLSGAATTPKAQRVGYGSKRSSGAWLPKEKTSAQALRDFEVPDLCVGSAVSYADGLQQRQVIKARGGEFAEQQFVVGMRFIVL